jgi:hypothetical protein
MSLVVHFQISQIGSSSTFKVSFGTSFTSWVLSGGIICLYLVAQTASREVGVLPPLLWVDWWGFHWDFGGLCGAPPLNHEMVSLLAFPATWGFNIVFGVPTYVILVICHGKHCKGIRCVAMCYLALGETHRRDVYLFCKHFLRSKNWLYVYFINLIMPINC